MAITIGRVARGWFRGYCTVSLGFFMQPTEIASFVSTRAATFGFNNPRNLQFCAARLRSVPDEAVLAGLLLVFTDSPPHPVGTAAQELAGRLLFAISPRGNFELKDFVRAAIKKWAMCMQLPEYLVHLRGKDAVATTLRLLEVEDLEINERRALSIMQGWVHHQPEYL